jgi:hypothetical protein
MTFISGGLEVVLDHIRKQARLSRELNVIYVVGYGGNFVNDVRISDFYSSRWRYGWRVVAKSGRSFAVTDLQGRGGDDFSTL